MISKVIRYSVPMEVNICVEIHEYVSQASRSLRGKEHCQDLLENTLGLRLGGVAHGCFAKTVKRQLFHHHTKHIRIHTRTRTHPQRTRAHIQYRKRKQNKRSTTTQQIHTHTCSVTKDLLEMSQETNNSEVRVE